MYIIKKKYLISFVHFMIDWSLTTG